MAKAAAPSPSSIPTSAPVAVLSGAERFLHLDYTRTLLAALKKEHGEVDILTFDGEKASPADVLDECRSMGLMVTRKLVIVDNADEMLKAASDDNEDSGSAARGRAPGAKSARELFEAYCAAPEPATTLLLRAGTWRPGKIDTAIQKAGGIVIKCEELRDSEAVKWALARAKTEHKVVLEPAAAEALVDALGSELARLDSEIGKLAITAAARNNSTTIDAALVKDMVGQSREDELWAFQAGILSGDPARALGELHRAMDVSRHNPVAVNVVYLDLCRKLDGIARGLAAGEPFGAIAGRLRLWQADHLKVIAQRLGPRRTGAMFEQTIETDAKLKSGRGDPVHLMEVLTLNLTRAMAS